MIKRFDASQGPRIVGPRDGKAVDLGSVGVRFMVWGEEAGGGFSLVEHPIAPRHLAAPLHRHGREDEYSYVLEGRLGALLGDKVVYAEAGDLAFKPRDEWHTFWNAGDSPCRILEIISPAGFEHFFDELASNPDAMQELGSRYALEADIEGTLRVCREHGLVFPPLTRGADQPH
jgi:mannose-6-phosphate isomerase-like protein (cupin superfamily)